MQKSNFYKTVDQLTRIVTVLYVFIYNHIKQKFTQHLIANFLVPILCFIRSGGNK